MSEHRFIEEQGELLEAAMTAAAERPDRSSGGTVIGRLRAWLRPHRKVAAVVLAVVVAGCGVAVAATGAFSSAGEKLALGKVDCYYPNPDGVHLRSAKALGQFIELSYDGPIVGGERPAFACRQQLAAQRSDYLTKMGLPALHNPIYLTCDVNATTAAVFTRSGSDPALRCAHLGLKPMPASVHTASTAVKSLVAQLEQQYRSRDCWQPRAFVRVARSALQQDGFTGWRVVAPKTDAKYGTMNGGRCASFSGPSIQSLSGYFVLSRNGKMHPRQHALVIGRGIPRSLTAIVTHENKQLSADAWAHCYSREGLRRLVASAFAVTGMTPRIAITTNPGGGPGFSWGTKAEARHYARGCPVLQENWPTYNDRADLVWFIARNGEHIQPFNGDPPLKDFQN